MAIAGPTSDEAYRGLTLLTLASAGAYAFIDPDLVEIMASLGWCTPEGEITLAGEDAFLEAQKVRARRGAAEGSALNGRPVRRNSTRRRPLR